jgi:sensor histidine kinase YesM
MKKKADRRKQIFANKIHREVFLFISAASLLPVSIATFLLYYLIFGIVSREIGIPEAIAYNTIPAAKRVLIILSLAAPISIAVLLVTAYKITHKIVGPFDRILREVDEHISGKRKGHMAVVTPMFKAYIRV